MTQLDYIKELARYGLENNQEKFVSIVNDIIEYSKNTKKLGLAVQLQSYVRELGKTGAAQKLVKVGSPTYYSHQDERELGELILQKVNSEYTFDNLISQALVREQLSYFLQEHRSVEMLLSYGLPVANKILFHGPSGCGKTLASYVIAGELKKPMVVVNLGAIVSSKLGETSKNLAKIFRSAAAEDCIIFIDEFDSLGKVRDYGQDHGEMKRVVNTILQLFDYLPQSSIVIAATNQVDMIDDALMRRFDLNLDFELPKASQLKELIKLTLKGGKFKFDNIEEASKIEKLALGLSYYSVQKTLITAIKQSLFAQQQDKIVRPLKTEISTNIWKKLVLEERKALLK
ncbi:MAG: AAA family ATPase [Flavobacterium sp.]|nr:MAG: AAA family ATPase [Flavobacterium sp.]